MQHATTGTSLDPREITAGSGQDGPPRFTRAYGSRRTPGGLGEAPKRSR